jgi:hypothetical protein
MPPEQELIPKGLYHSAQPIPKGLHHSAQGCAPSATLGGRWVSESTLKGLYRLSRSHRSIPHIILCKGRRSNPFRVKGPLARAPRVALGAQPWAERCNPFGIAFGDASSARRMSKLQEQARRAPYFEPTPRTSVLLAGSAAGPAAAGPKVELGLSVFTSRRAAAGPAALRYPQTRTTP